MAPQQVSSILEQIASAGKAYEKNEPGSREVLIDQSRALVASLEIPSEFLQRTFWAEVSSRQTTPMELAFFLSKSLQELQLLINYPLSTASVILHYSSWCRCQTFPMP